MVLTPDWVSAIAAAASAVLLFGTITLGYVQLRDLKKSSQLQNFISLAQESETSGFAVAYAFVLRLRGLTIADKNRLATGADGVHFDTITNFFERIGFLVSGKYVDRKLAITWWGVLAKDAYDSLDDWISIHQRRDPGFCSEYQGFVAAAESHWRQCGRRTAESPEVGAPSLR